MPAPGSIIPNPAIAMQFSIKFATAIFLNGAGIHGMYRAFRVSFLPRAFKNQAFRNHDFKAQFQLRAGDSPQRSF